MLTGTPLDLTPFGPLLSWFGVAYWLLALALAAFALWVPGRWWLKVPAAIGILTAFVYPVLTHRQQVQQQVDQFKVKLDAATTQFQMRCQSAGEKVSRTVDNVEGVVWMKWRDQRDVKDDFDQYKLFDPYGPACAAGDCLKLLLRPTQNLEIDPQRRMPFYRGYRFVEALDPADGTRYRYVMRLRPGNLDHQELVRTPIAAWSTRFGVTWDDISTNADRDHWIAGSSMRVIDLTTNEVIAERIGYMMDPGQGSQAGYRSPWLMAERTACPSFDPSESGHPSRWSRSHGFVLKVLRPSTEK